MLKDKRNDTHFKYTSIEETGTRNYFYQNVSTTVLLDSKNDNFMNITYIKNLIHQ